MITVQECRPGEPLIEDEWKKWVSGERIACRPLFGKTTEYFAWNRTGKIWEVNKAFPSIRGDPNRLDQLRSFTRRILAIEFKATFASGPAKINPSAKVFRENAHLNAFLESPEVRLAYWKCFLIPYIQSHTPEECTQTLLNPPDEIVEATRRVVAQMANGGINVPDSYLSEDEEARQTNEAAELIIKVFERARELGRNSVKHYDVAKTFKNIIPGAHHPSRKGTTKLENLERAIALWPHLVLNDEDRKQMRFLDFNYGLAIQLLDQ